MAPSFHLCGYVRGGFRNGTVASARLSVWKRVFPQLLPWCQTPQFISVCHWCLSSCCPSAGAPNEWVWLSLCVGCLKRTAWDSRSSSTDSIRADLCSQKLWRIIFLALEPWAGWHGVGLGLLVPKISLPNFVWTYRYRTSLFCISVPPTILDRCGFFNSIVVRLPFNSVSDGSEW